MAELMRQRHHVARLAHVVEQHIGMRRRHRRMREGARRLAGPHRRVDPVAVEEGAGDLGHVGREALIGRQHRVLAPRPSRSSPAGSRAAARCGPSGSSPPCRASAPSSHSSDATGADRRRARRRPAHRRRSRSTRLARWRESAMSLKPRQRSEISLSLASVLVISVKMRRFLRKVAASASAALRRTSRVGVLQPVQRRLERQLLAVDVEAQLRHRLVEQPVPGAAPGDRLFVEELLDPVLELVGLVHPADRAPRAGSGRTPDRRRARRRSARRRSGSVRARRTADARWRRSSFPGCRHRAWRAADRPCCRHRPGRHRRRCGRSVPRAPRSREAPRRAGRRARRGLGGERALPAVFEGERRRLRPCRCRASVRAHPCRNRGRRGSIPAGRRARPRLRPLPPLASCRPLSIAHRRSPSEFDGNEWRGRA